MEALWSRRWLVWALLGLGGALVFGSALDHSFHYDDEHSIVQNPHIRSLGNIPRFFVDAGSFSGLPEARMYRPLLLVSYAFNYALGGYEVFGYHLVNLFLHLGNAALVWSVAARLLGRGPAALGAALFFALHPLMSEPVNYISSRSSLLAGLFYLLGWRALMRAAEAKSMAWAALGALGYAAALGSKEIASSFPVCMGLYLFLWRARRPWRLLALPAGLSLVYVLGTRALIGRALMQPVRPHWVQWATQTKALVYYVWIALMPVHLSVEPQFKAAQSAGEGAVVLAGLLLLSLFLVALKGARRRRLLFFGAAWFFIALLPAALVPLHVLVNEHRLYLPLVGLALGAAALVRGSGWAPGVGAGLALVLLALLAAQRNRVWESEETLWADAVARSPLMARPHANLGKAYLEQGRFAEAIAASRRALALDPHLGRAYYNIGTAYLRQDALEEAIANYRRALEIEPGLLEAHNNLGNAYQEEGRFQAAVDSYRRALALQPSASLYHNAGNALLGMGEIDAAMAYFDTALALDPGSRESYKGMIKACAVRQRWARALELAQQALRRWPQDALFWHLRGDAHAALGQEHEAARAYERAGDDAVGIALRLGAQAQRRRDWARARAHYQRALQGGGEARIYNALGEVDLAQGEIPRALAAFRRAAQLDPELAAAYANIGRAYMQRGGSPEALAALERAVELDEKAAGFWALLGQAYQEAGRAAEAAAAYRKAIARAPQRAEVYQNLGLLYQQQGYATRAERLYREALERNPRLVQALYNLGNVRLEQGRFAEAAAAYERALEWKPGYAEVYVNLASARLELGQPQAALAAYERFLELGPDNEELRRKISAQVEVLRKGGRRAGP